MKRMYDNTRVSAHRECGRKFYYRHVKDWSMEGTAPELVFGLGWHAAMDEVWSIINAGDFDTSTLLTRGYEAFMDKWKEEGMKDPQAMDPIEYDALKMRTPDTLLEMLAEYINVRKDFIKRGKLIAVERPFVVPLDPDGDKDLFYCGRLDKVFATEDGELIVVEHKTSSAYRKPPLYFKAEFTDSFSPNSQVDGYAYAAHLIYGDRFKRILVDAALVHKTVHDGFAFIPVQRNMDQLDAWRWETLEEIRRIEESKSRLRDPSCTTLNYLPAFPKNTNSCWSYHRPCAYTDLCKMWGNPYGRPTPPGFVKEHWSPFNHIKLEELGFTREETGE